MFNIIRFDEIDSTNDHAIRNLDSFNDRDVILAETQKKGHGRFSRKWVSHVPENIYMSIVLKPNIKITDSSPLANITQYMSLVICDVLDLYNTPGQVKWPNDVLVKGAKIAGLLSQSSIQEKQLKGYVLGVGINLNMSPGVLKQIDQPATSLNLETGMAVDRDQFLDKLLKEFFSGYENFLKNGFPSIKEQYIHKTSFLGKEIRVALMDTEVAGTAKGFSDDGCLILVTDQGKEQKITIGDVLISP
jgi:BirA family biotin operon repressor/biotin-[acetyl-CoA-carboxylase] ligase